MSFKWLVSNLWKMNNNNDIIQMVLLGNAIQGGRTKYQSCVAGRSKPVVTTRGRQCPRESIQQTLERSSILVVPFIVTYWSGPSIHSLQRCKKESESTSKEVLVFVASLHSSVLGKITSPCLGFASSFHLWQLINTNSTKYVHYIGTHTYIVIDQCKVPIGS